MSERVNEIVDRLEEFGQEGSNWLDQLTEGGADVLEEIADIREYAQKSLSKMANSKARSPNSAIYLHRMLERLRTLEAFMCGLNTPLVEFGRIQREFLSTARILTSSSGLRTKHQCTQTRISVPVKPKEEPISKIQTNKPINQTADISNISQIENEQSASTKKPVNDVLVKPVDLLSYAAPTEEEMASAVDCSALLPKGNKPALQDLLQLIPGPAPKDEPMLNWAEELVREDEERQAVIRKEKKQLEEERERERREWHLLTFQRERFEVKLVELGLRPCDFDWIEDGDGTFRVLYKDKTGELNFFIAERIPSTNTPYFEISSLYDILPEQCTMVIYVGDQFECETKNGWLVCQLDLSIYRSLISSHMLKIRVEEWKRNDLEKEKLNYRRCKEARFRHHTNFEIYGCNKQKFEVTAGIVTTHHNPFFDHKRLILGQQFLNRYAVGLDLLDPEKDNLRTRICRLLLQTEDVPAKIWSTTLERKRNEW